MIRKTFLTHIEGIIAYAFIGYKLHPALSLDVLSWLVPYSSCREFKKEAHRLVQVAACKSPLQLSKTWFRGSLLKKPKLCLSLWHALRNSFNDGFSATCWSCSNITKNAAIFDRRSRGASICRLRHSSLLSLGLTEPRTPRD